MRSSVIGFTYVRDVMSSPAVTIDEDSLLTGAVDLMLDKSVKRLPVVDRRCRIIDIRRIAVVDQDNRFH